MEYQGNLLKMKAYYTKPIDYFLELNENDISMNALIGKEIEITYLNQINCIKCGRKTNKSFAQGFCFPCFQSAPETEECVLRPELCRAHEGIARDLEFAKTHCLINHFVYLSYTSGIKVGVTRHTQIPTRWIDQGATSAIKLAQTPDRFTAGCIEVAMKNYFDDKTNWRKMLIRVDSAPEMRKVKEEAELNIPEIYGDFLSDDDTVTQLEYPFIETPEKIKSISLDKVPEIRDVLVGIKGQYLIFRSGNVLNVRKHNGYKVKLQLD